MKYIFEVRDDNDEVVFRAEKPTLEMIEEEIGRVERIFLDTFFDVEEGEYDKTMGEFHKIIKEHEKNS